MKVHIEAHRQWLCESLWRGSMNSLIFAVGFLFALVSIGIWLGLCEDNCSLLILSMAAFGSIKADVFVHSSSESDGENEPQVKLPEYAMLAHLKRVFRLGMMSVKAHSVSLTLWDTGTGQRVDWSMESAGDLSAVMVANPEPCHRPRYTNFSAGVYVRKGSEIMCSGVDCEDQPISKAILLNQLQSLWRDHFQTLLLASIHIGTRWQGTLAYIDPPVLVDRRGQLRMLQRIVDIATSGTNMYDMACHTTRISERRRLARDLHDGVMQSLIATELQVALLETAESNTESKAAKALKDVLETLRRETQRLRCQIEELQCGEISEPLRARLACLVREFEDETKIATEFWCDSEIAEIPPKLKFEVTSLLAEALSNVRKHSGAKNTQIHLSCGEMIHVCVQDDGRGFNLSGRYTLPELLLLDQKPRSICERVLENAGQLILESSPGAGARLEISIPLHPEHIRAGGDAPVALHSFKRKPHSSQVIISRESNNRLRRIQRTL